MKTILLVDDDPTLRMLVHTTLLGPECRILEAGNVEQAFQLAVRESPDVIVLDWMLPGKSGIHLAQQLRRTPRMADIPVIMLTARGQLRDRQTAAEVGVAAYLVKPFSPLELMDRVRSTLAVS